MQSLKNLFDSASAETRGHLLYRSPQCFQSNRYSVCKPICGFFFLSYYTALLQKERDHVFFTPSTQLFQSFFP